MLPSTNTGSWFSYLQPNFAKIVQMKLFLLNVDWEEESHLLENKLIYSTKIHICNFILYWKLLFLQGIIFYLTKYLANIPLLILNLCEVM